MAAPDGAEWSQDGLSSPAVAFGAPTVVPAPGAVRRFDRSGAIVSFVGAMLVVTSIVAYVFGPIVLTSLGWSLLTASYAPYALLEALEWGLFGAGVVCLAVGWYVDRRWVYGVFEDSLELRTSRSRRTGAVMVLVGAGLIACLLFFLVGAFVSQATGAGIGFSTLVVVDLLLLLALGGAVLCAIGWFIDRLAVLEIAERRRTD